MTPTTQALLLLLAAVAHLRTTGIGAFIDSALGER